MCMLLVAILFGCAGSAEDSDASDVTVVGATGKTVRTEAQQIPRGRVTVDLSVVIPKEHAFTEGFVHQVSVSDSASETAWEFDAAALAEPIEIPITVTDDTDQVVVSLRIGHCEKTDAAVCFVHSGLVEIPIEPRSRGEDTVRIEYTIE